jgi:hypothetical protein
MVRMGMKKKVAATLAVALGAGGIVAYAFWTGSGSGSGSATTTTTLALTVNQTGAAVTGLYPGGPAKNLSGTFDNPNAGPMYISAVTASVTATSAGGCSASDFVISGTATVNADIPAGNGVGSWSGLQVSMTDTASNQDACKSATITITYAAS